MKRFLFYLLIFSLSFCEFTIANTLTDDFKSQLYQLKKENNLRDWIYLRIEYTGENPSKNLDFLMSTQKEVWRKLNNPEEKEAWLYLLINQAYYQLFTGDIIKSIEFYEDANDYQIKQKINIDSDEFILKPLANNYTRIGDYEKAIFIQNKSLNLALQTKSDSLSASIYNNLAISYLFKKDFDNATSSVLSGLKMVNPNNRIYGLLYSVLADINYQQNNLTNASKYVETAIQHLQKQNSDYWLLSVYTLSGNIKFKQQSFDESNQYYDKGITLIANKFKNARKRELSHLLIQKGKIAILNKDFKTANILLNKALNNLVPTVNNSLPPEKELFAERNLQEVLLAKADVSKALGKEELALQASLLAFETAEKIRQEYTYSTSKKQLQTEAKKIAEQILNNAYSLWKKTKNEKYASIMFSISEKTKSRILLDEILDNQQKIASNNETYSEKIKIERAIAYYEKQQRENQDKSYYKNIDELKFKLSSLEKKLKIANVTKPLNVHELLSKIPNNTKVISYFFGQDFIFLIDAEKGKINTIKKIENARILEKQTFNFLDKYFYNGPSAMMNSPSQFHTASFNLYHQLLSGINFKSNQNIILIRDGVLNLLAFEGLLTENRYQSKIENWPFLIKKANISYGFSLQTIASNSRKKNSKTNSFDGFFISNTGINKVTIPEVEIEYNYLKKHIAGNFHLNNEADVKTFKNAFSNTDVLHLSSHAYISKENSESVLELYKDKFYLFELNSLYKAPNLVVLSACQTADGELIEGEGVLSMSRGFTAAGTQGVVSGLWKVNDKTGAQLVNSFYQNLLELKDVNLSLRKAKLDWLNNKNQNKIMLLPYYWDSLIYAGNNQEINLDKSYINTLNIFLGIIAIGLFTVLFLFIKRNK